MPVMVREQIMVCFDYVCLCTQSIGAAIVSAVINNIYVIPLRVLTIILHPKWQKEVFVLTIVKNA